MSRVVVVGAGVGGLAVAARLACQGHDVLVLEAASTVGGKLGSFEREGFRFDTGPSLLTMPWVFEDLFAATGGWPDGLELQRLDPITRYRFSDGSTLDCGADLDEQCRRMEALAEGAGAEWKAFLDRARRIWEASRTPFLESALQGPGSLAALALRHPADLATLAPGRSLQYLAKRYLHDRRLQMLVGRYATYSGSDPRRAPAALAAIAWVEQSYGGWYLTGGLRTLADALLDRCVGVGVAVRTGVRVARIPTPVGGVVLEDGGHVPADLVVANSDAAQVYADLVPCPSAQRKLARATPSLSAFVVLLAVQGRTEGLAQHNVLFPLDYEAEFDAVFGDPARPADDPAIYVSVSPDGAPNGQEAWFVLVNAARHGTGEGAVDWRATGLADRYADRLLALLAERGLPVADRVLWREIRTPADLEEQTGAPGGAIYGTSSNGAAAAFLRPANRSPVPGLFLVGGSSHPGGGLPLVALSAQIVSGLIGRA